MTTRPRLADRSIAPAAVAAMSTFHEGVVAQVEAAVAREQVVVVGMAQNPHVKKVRQALDQAGVTYTYLEYGSYLSKWKERLAIKLWSGWPTFPQVFVRGVLVGGEALTVAGLADGSLKGLLETAAVTASA